MPARLTAGTGVFQVDARMPIRWSGDKANWYGVRPLNSFVHDGSPRSWQEPIRKVTRFSPADVLANTPDPLYVAVDPAR